MNAFVENFAKSRRELRRCYKQYSNNRNGKFYQVEKDK